MGAAFSCIDDQVEPLQRLHYDMTPFKSRNLPVVWFVGPPGSGRDTQVKLLAENLGFVRVKVAELLKDESGKDTDRARIISEGLHHRGKKVPDFIVIDLIKEEMLKKAANAKGFIIDNFPKNSKQANMFVREIGECDVIVYLICDLAVMVERKKKQAEGARVDEDVIKRAIATYIKQVKEGISRFGSKIEKVRTNDPPPEVYSQIEAAITIRISTKSKITSEADYAQSQEHGEISSLN